MTPLFRIALAAGCVGATLAQADDRPSFASLWAEATRSPDCKPTEYPDFTLVACEKNSTLWYFTKPNHPADPGVIKREVTQRAGGIYIGERGWSFASDARQPAFQKWLDEFKALDERMKAEMERRRRQTNHH